MATPHNSVAEMQGLYGPFTMAERVVQKIWLQQDFAGARASLSDGRALEVISPGRWNLLGGPDFRQACLRIAGREVSGDVEVHFHATDWTAHGHRGNSAYADVVLHVLLFPPESDSRPQRRADGAEIPALVLLPLLHRDLEEYAADDALETITARDEWRRLEELANLPLEEVRATLRSLAQRRWERKVDYARTRIAKLGWESAAHHTALEILGYRHNRVPMLAVAERWPLALWSEAATPGAALEGVTSWQRHGVRPANHPARRLAQYQEWTRLVPEWPLRLDAWGRQVAPGDSCRELGSAEARRNLGLAVCREQLGQVAGRAVPGPRFETLVCDGFLPLAAARVDRPDLGEIWFHWYAGDLPDQIRRALPRLGVTGSRKQPLCHGFAQGLLAWLIEREFCA